MVDRVFSQAESGEATDGNGEPISFNSGLFADAGESTSLARAVLQNVAGLFSHFQCFMHVDSDGPFLELTFFPDDVLRDRDPLQSVVHFLRDLCSDTSVTQYFVRYENASWTFGDTTSMSGVIFTRTDVETVA